MTYIKLLCCKYCSLSFNDLSVTQRANHSRWCPKNPKSSKHKKDLAARAVKWHTGKKRSAETKEKIKQAHKDGKYSHIDYAEVNVGRPHTPETKEIIRQKALASPHRRLKRKMIDYNGILLDSTWELALAQRLDDLGIKWVRPAPLVWVDDKGQSHHYFPDFYLLDFDLYLDPKNPQAVKSQQKKLDILSKQYYNIRILTTLSECKNFTAY